MKNKSQLKNSKYRVVMRKLYLAKLRQNICLQTRDNVEVDQTDITGEVDTSDIDELFEDNEFIDGSLVETDEQENVPDEREDIDRDDEIWRLDGNEDR
jgi:hypothetical protein